MIRTVLNGGRKIMFRSFLLRAVSKQLSYQPNVTKQLCHHPFQFHSERGMHSRNKKAMEFIAKGWNALQEVDRVIDYCELNDKRLIPPLRTAKENFELALEADNSNTHARYWLSKLHLKYHVPGACKAVGAALLVEAAEMGDPEAQFELACRLRIENEYVQSDQQAFYYLEKAVDQLHPGALYLLGAVYLTGDCVQKDVGSALWCFHRASQKGHAGAAIAYGSLLLTGNITKKYEKALLINDRHRCQTSGVKGIMNLLLLHINSFEDDIRLVWVYLRLFVLSKLRFSISGVELPESITKFYVKRGSSRRNGVDSGLNPIELAREQFEIAAKAGSDLGFRWLQRLEEEVKRLQSS